MCIDDILTKGYIFTKWSMNYTRYCHDLYQIYYACRTSTGHMKATSSLSNFINYLFYIIFVLILDKESMNTNT